ncbi:tigger transposable element-derived protein 1-like [Bacillus rossius redtenbacheri]|uniref:tigger transposable element-derived protein 1-like n=1 Tax=Bacillus rossius redtenbacheri TaxID=93214 RepID=UPI002FDD70D5
MNPFNPQKKRGSWTQDGLSKAVDAVRLGNLSVNAASKRYVVPRRTLRRYLSNNQDVKSKLGCKATLKTEEERELSRRIIRLANVGYPLTSKMLKLNVFKYCRENGITHRFTKETAGRYWLNNFLARNPEISKRKAQRLNPARAQKLNKFIVGDHFEKLQNVLAENKFLNFPEKIFNMDEKGCRLQLHKDPEVLAKKGSKRVHIVAKERGESVTVVACGNATGNVIPPMILFPGLRKNPAWEKNLPTGSTTIMTRKGSMTTESFVSFLNHFSRFKPSGPCLLIFDGAKSHLDYSICEVAEQNEIILYCLPSNTTHELQPLDKGCFRSFEIFWDQHTLLYFNMHKEQQDISKLNFADVFTPTWEKSMTQANMKSGFKATGIFPFNPFVIPEEAFAPSIATELPPPNTKMADETVTAYALQEQHNSNDDHSLAGPSGLQTNVSQLGSRHSTSSSSDSDITGDLAQPSSSSDYSDSLHIPESTANLSRRGSIGEMLPTPKKKRKTTRVMKPAINNRGVVLNKSLFEDNKDVKLDSSKNSGNSKKYNTKSVRQITASKKSESWYCAICCNDEVKDMRLCGVCEIYVHEECVGLTKDDKEFFICPKCLL